MRPLLALLLIKLLLCACAENTDISPFSGGESVYDESLIETPPDAGENLIRNGSFESEGIWELCGGTYYLDDPTAPSGGKVMELSGEGEICYEDYFGFFNKDARFSQEVLGAKGEELLFISFWIKIEGELESNISCSFYLSSTYTSEDYFVGSSGRKTSGWTRIQFIVTESDRDFYLDNDSPIFFVISTDDLKGAKIYLDDIQIKTQMEYSTPSSMPDDLKNYTGEERLVFMNWTNNSVATMAPNGSNMVNYDHIALDFANTPSWISQAEIAISEKYFVPALPQDPATVAAASTKFLKYSLDRRGEGSVLYESLGVAGKYYFSGSYDNTEALDVEVWNADWDLDRNRYAMSVCARNRLPGFVSDDVCLIYLMDANTHEVLNDETRGVNPKWSASGKLVYYNDFALHLARIEGTELRSEELYRSEGEVYQVADWSPDEQSIVFAEKNISQTFLNGEKAYVGFIKILDLQTRASRTIVAVDFGNLLNDLNWSKDGKYIYYTVKMPNGNQQIWWADVMTSQTGPVTNTISAGYANWSH